MAKKIDDGGYAFPQGTFGGMSLRDWFAGQVVQGFLAHHPHDEGKDPNVSWPDPDIDLAILSYEYADAMLRARKEQADG